MDKQTLPPTLVDAWQDLTPRHQALLLTMIKTLADEDRAPAENPAADDKVPSIRELAPADFATMIQNLALQGPPPTPAPDAWVGSVGMFDGNPAMDDIWEAGRQIREAERF